MASSSGGRGSSVQVAAPLQDGIGNCRENLTQCQQQRLGGRHLEGRPILGEQPTFKDAGFVPADRLPERIGDGALQPSIVLYWNKVRVIRPEPGQHVRMNVAVEVVHQERAEHRDANFFIKLIEQVLEVHAGGDVSALPQDIDQFSPRPHFVVAPSSARLPEDVPKDAAEYSRIRHGVPHEAGQEFVGVNHRQLSALLCRMHIHAFGLEAWAEVVPVGERWKKHDALPVRETSADEAADGAAEKILVLIELHDVIAWGSVRHHSIPGLVLLRVKLTVHGTWSFLAALSGGMSEIPRIQYRDPTASSDQKQAGIVSGFSSARGKGAPRFLYSAKKLNCYRVLHAAFGSRRYSSDCTTLMR